MQKIVRMSLVWGFILGIIFSLVYICHDQRKQINQLTHDVVGQASTVEQQSAALIKSAGLLTELQAALDASSKRTESLINLCEKNIEVMTQQQNTIKRYRDLADKLTEDLKKKEKVVPPNNNASDPLV
jgi:uncharacterized coiled-coil protein SlyX